MKRALAFILLLLCLIGCRTSQVPINHETIYTYIDSVIIKRDTINVQIPKEIYRDYTTLLDTLRLETSVAKAQVYVDTNTMLLNGELKNKPVKIRKEIVTVDRIIRKDSVVVKEVPVEVVHEVYRTPKWVWVCLAGAIAAAMAHIIRWFLKK